MVMFMVSVETRAGNEIWLNPNLIESVYESKYGVDNNPYIAITMSGNPIEIHAKGTVDALFEKMRLATAPIPEGA